MIIHVLKSAGKFAENKDIASQLRINHIMPAIEKQEEIVLDFSGVTSATQSFIHALISDIIRKRGIAILDQITFKGCNKTIKTLVKIVFEYMQDVPEILEQ